MSRFFKEKLKTLEAYTPGEQPQDKKYIKLNTNESPFAPDKYVVSAAQQAAAGFNVYNDPECSMLREEAAALYEVDKDNILCGNGSDEILYLAFTAFIEHAVFPDITYGFYKVFADLTGADKTIVPLRDEFKLDTGDYADKEGTLIIANPNAQTGRYIPVCEIEQLVKAGLNRLVIIDEAYIDFGGESCVPLIKKYDNLLVTQTFSKSRSMAGARLGFAFGSKPLIADMNTVRYSLNPYNVGSVAQAAGIAAIRHNDIYMQNCREIIANREFTEGRLRALGFDTVPSQSNFILAKTDKVPGEQLYMELKKQGILVRHFRDSRISDYVRITIGTKQQMEALTLAAERIINA